MNQLIDPEKEAAVIGKTCESLVAPEVRRILPANMDNVIDSLLSAFIAYLESPDAAMLGWVGFERTGKIADFRGKPPASGFAQSNVESIKQIAYIRDVDLKVKQAAFLLLKLSPLQQLAVIGFGFYRHQPSETDTGKMKGDEIAARVGMTLDQFKSNKRRGRECLKKEYSAAIGAKALF